MKYFLWVLLAGWMLLSILLHIMPSPLLWGNWAFPLMKFFEANELEIQSVSHVVLMSGFAFLLMYFFHKQTRLAAFIMVLGLTMLFAVLMEGMQGVLPSGFKRACDPADLLPALAGALIGSLAGLILPRSNE